jgi:hypothetical protein
MLNTQALVLADVRTTLCGGNTQFVMAQDAAGIVDVSWYQSTGTVMEPNRDIAVDQLIDGMEFDGADAFSSTMLAQPVMGIVGGRFALKRYSTASVPVVANLSNFQCVDLLGLAAKNMRCLGVMQDAVGNASASTCEDAQHLCHQDTGPGTRARIFCPVTCGCNNYFSSLVLTDPESGCPPMCMADPDTYYYSALTSTGLANRSCTDAISGSPELMQYQIGINGILDTWIDHGYSSDLRDFAVQGFRDHGCGVVRLPLMIILFGDLCREQNMLRYKPMALLCPETCGCPNSRLLCPGTC